MTFVYFHIKIRSYHFLIILLLVLTCNSFSQTTANWIGGFDTDFYNVNNWDDTSIDFSNIQTIALQINSGSPYNPIQNGGNSGNSDYRPGKLNISDGADATFNGALLPWDNDYINGLMTLNAPAYINIRSDVYVGNSTNGTIIINGGELHSKNKFHIGYNNNGNGSVNVLGGSLFVGTYLEMATSPNATSPIGILNISGGTVYVTNGINFGNNGKIHISDVGTLILNNNYKTALEGYISLGKITCTEGKTLDVNYDGSNTIVSIAQDPNSLLKEYGTYIVLDNGILRAVIDKYTSNITSLKVNGIETLAQTNYSHSDRVGTYFSFNGSYGYITLSNCKFSIKEETENYIDVSFKRTYSENDLPPAVDVDIHYVLKKNDTGLYSYNILHHLPEYPDFDLGIWRQVLWIGNDNTNYLTEKIYVTDKKSWEMPSVYDYQNASPTKIQEIVKLNTGVRAGKYDGKYEYSENILDLPVWGHASDINNIGLWTVFGSHEFFPQGPTSHDLNAASGIIHVLFTHVHYNSKGFTIPQGQEWSKIYGPYLIYTSLKDTGSKNWEDAKIRATIERNEWPYPWLTNTLEYPQASGRGNIVGSFNITDPAKPEIDGGDAWIGVTQLNPDSGGDWQFESKSYQYWTKTDASGNFDIKNIRPGTYTLFAFKNGETGEYSMQNVTVAAAETTNLGTINWTIPRNNGNLVWEIGIPNRTSEEFKLGDFNYCEGFTEFTFESNFPNPIEYNIADKNWSEVLPYAHTKYILADSTRLAWNWNLNFDLIGTIPSTGSAKLTLAFASVDHAQFWLYANGNTIHQTYLNGIPSGGNALIRQSNRSKYGIQIFDIPYDKLKMGKNTITLVMPSNQNSSHLMYDYISLEGDLTAVLSTNNFDKTGSSFRVFPNPAMESIHVKVDHENITKLTISVLNLLGEKIIKTSPEKSISNIYSIDIKNKLTSGIYMIKVDTETASYVSKIVVK